MFGKLIKRPTSNAWLLYPVICLCSKIAMLQLNWVEQNSVIHNSCWEICI